MFLSLVTEYPQDVRETRIADCDKPKRANGGIDDESARAKRTTEAETSRNRVASSGFRMRLYVSCLQALHDRVLSADVDTERTNSDDLLTELFASATLQPVTSDRLDPTQLQQLQQLVTHIRTRLGGTRMILDVCMRSLLPIDKAEERLITSRKGHLI
jgi:hypothetical protein